MFRLVADGGMAGTVDVRLRLFALLVSLNILFEKDVYFRILFLLG